FDHQAPIYVYLEYLPLYALPWSPFLIGVVWRAATRWKELGPDSRWPLWASLLILVFLTLSGGRRNYYLLPILPIVMLAIADWIHEPASAAPRRKAAFWTAAVSALGLFAYFGILSPILFRVGDTRNLSAEIRRAAEQQAPWNDWRVVMYNTKPQVGFYLNPVVRARFVLTPE